MKFCKVADIADWQDEAFQATASLLQLESVRNRQIWPLIQIYTGLHQLGLLGGQATALGLAVGDEPLIYAFANGCNRVVATDLYDLYNGREALTPQEVYRRNPFPYATDRLEVRPMDLTRIDYPDHSFDFIWSCRAIEQMTNFEALYQLYREIHRVLKPGGIAALAAGFNPTNRPSYEPAMLLVDHPWVQAWLTGDTPLLQGFELIDAVDYSVSPQPENPPVLPNAETGIQVYYQDILLSSMALFLRKTGEFSTSYSEDWLDPFWRIYLLACDAYRTQQYQQAENLLRQLVETDLPDRLRLRALQRLADTLMAQGNSEALKAVCETAVPYAEQSEDGDLLMRLARYCRKTGLLNEALLLYRRVVELPSVPPETVGLSYRAQAKCLMQQGHYQQALTLIQMAETYNVNERHQLEWLRGSCYQDLGQLEEAIRCYDIAAKIAPEQDYAFRERCVRDANKCLRLQLSQTNKQLTQLQDNRLLQVYTSLRSAGRSVKRWLRFGK
ncbi:MAG: methyltransferase domain-containing protein [Leptolyngbya sp. IPPAS B-1204]|nr:MAG: methyltransferase domain-containing protein [Leptolyngbya sp. IPPAS B-1204]